MTIPIIITVLSCCCGWWLCWVFMVKPLNKDIDYWAGECNRQTELKQRAMDKLRKIQELSK